MTIRRLAALAATITLMLVGMLGVTGATASASPVSPGFAPNNCPNSSMCGYNNQGWDTNNGYEINPVRANGVCANVAFNDQWSSIWNGSGKTVRFFINANCGGSSFTLSNGSGAAYLGISHPTFSDEISSYRWGG